MEQINKARKNIENGFKLIVEMDKLFERWKKIDGYDNYTVSTFGRVRNDDTNKILKNSFNSHGYHHVGLYKNNKETKMKIHRLVANAFIKNPEGKKCVDHINNNKIDNNITNLRWATDSENQHNKTKLQHSYIHY